VTGLREALEDMVGKADQRAAERREQGRPQIAQRVGIDAIRGLLAEHANEPTEQDAANLAAAARAFLDNTSEMVGELRDLEADLRHAAKQSRGAKVTADRLTAILDKDRTGGES
jgi:hypothetical protein